MSVTVNLHPTHRHFTDGQATVAVEGKSIGECLDSLVSLYPHMAQALYDAQGSLKNHLEIFLNMDSAYPDELKKPVQEGDDIHIIVLLAGG